MLYFDLRRVNVFKPGTGTITIWENTGGTRGAVLYQKKGIPLTPGPLMVVIKVASSQVANTTGYWPPALPDSIETIAASYVESASMSKLRLFNLSPVRAQQSRCSQRLWGCAITPAAMNRFTHICRQALHFAHDRQ